jgi:hypothetical protein
VNKTGAVALREHQATKACLDAARALQQVVPQPSSPLIDDRQRASTPIEEPPPPPTLTFNESLGIIRFFF